MPSMRSQWRSLEELSRDPKFLARAAREFPSIAGALNTPGNRRQVLKLLAAGLALAGLGGCDGGEPGGALIPPVLPQSDAVARGRLHVRHSQRVVRLCHRCSCPP